MIKPACEACPVTDCPVMALANLADRVETAIPLAQFEVETTTSALAREGEARFALEMEGVEAKVVDDMVGLPLMNRPDQVVDRAQRTLAVLDGGDAARKVNRDNINTGVTTVAGSHAAEWVSDTREFVDEAAELCDGPVKGIRIPLIRSVLIAPDILGLGKWHCGSYLREYAAGRLVSGRSSYEPAVTNLLGDAQPAKTGN